MKDNFKTLRELKDFIDDFDHQYQAGSFGPPVDDEREEEVKTVTMDMPLFIRLLEFAREDASNDVDLHVIAENAERLMNINEYLTMKNYDALLQGIVGKPEAENEDSGY